MRFLAYSRALARRYRVAFSDPPASLAPEIGASGDLRVAAEHLWTGGRAVLDAAALLERLLASIDAAEISIEPDRAGLLQDARATLSFSEGVLLLDPLLDAPDRIHEKILVLAHEVGHIAQHADLADWADRVESTDVLMEPAAWGSAGAATARYSRNATVEAEANAFATELLCPADAVFDLWRRQTSWTAEQIAKELDLPVPLVRVQLAEGLRRYVAGEGEAAAEPQRPPRPRRFNERQEYAARSVARPTLINAGPGTGKTATLAQHISFLVQEGTNPREILALTFSNEAADELRERIEGLFGRDIARRMTIATFHGFGYQLLLHYGHLLGVKGEPRILDVPAQEDLLSVVLGQVACREILSLRNPRETAVEARKHLSHLKNSLVTLDALEEAILAWTPEDEEGTVRKQRAGELLALYRAYEAAKRPAEGGWSVDFGDLILLPYELLRDHEEMRSEVQARWRRLVVDEYQDTGRGVAPFLQQLTGPENLPWVVGDPRQSIHRFRGAAPENVRNFRKDFAHAGEADEVSLEINYRSAPGIVRVANQLATLLEDRAHAGPEREYWRADDENPADVETPFTVAVANCDAAERHHAVQFVQNLIDDWHVNAREIAVLARTNAGVRQLGLALREARIPVAAGGIVTEEGAGGDLAAVVLLPDAARAAIPRVAFALGRSAGWDAETINAAIRVLLDTAEVPHVSDEIAGLVDEVRAVGRAAEAVSYVADPWLLLSVFLFDASTYLRRFLEDRAAEAELALDEIVTALSRAAGHRFARRDLGARESRLLFSEHFRRALTQPTETVDSERTHRDAVRVMTCHASKGLQFPYVVVTGQSSRFKPGSEEKKAKPRYAWLPDAFQPDPASEREQEDSVLFVAVTRAERQALVSYAVTANDRPKSPKRAPVRLLGEWLTQFGGEPAPWNLSAPAAEAVYVLPIWGPWQRRRLAARHLADESCAIQIYLEIGLGVRVPVLPQPLYPELIGRVRSALRRVVETAIEARSPVAEESAAEIFDTAWPPDEHPGHPHEAVYRTEAREAVLAFAVGYSPAGEMLLEEAVDQEDAIILGLIALAERPGGARVAIGLRAESLVGRSKDGETILWGKLEGAARLPFALAAGEGPDLEARVFSIRDRRGFRYAINPRNLPDTVAKARARHNAVSTAGGVQTIREKTCERCGVRIACPHWMGLLPIAMEEGLEDEALP